MRDAHLDNQFDGWGLLQQNSSAGLTSNLSLIPLNLPQNSSFKTDKFAFTSASGSWKCVFVSYTYLYWSRIHICISPLYIFVFVPYKYLYLYLYLSRIRICRRILEIKLANVLCLRRMEIILITNKQVLESWITFQVYKRNKQKTFYF